MISFIGDPHNAHNTVKELTAEAVPFDVWQLALLKVNTLKQNDKNPAGADGRHHEEKL
jgi:hypothetical protein